MAYSHCTGLGPGRDREWDQHNRRQWVRFLSLSQHSVNSKHNIEKPIDPGPVPCTCPSSGPGPGSVQCEHAIRSSVSFLRRPLLKLLFTDRVRSTRGKVIVSLCLSVHTCRGGGTPARSSQPEGGTPHWVPPPLDLAREVPHLRYLPVRPGGGVPRQGDPTLGAPPIGPGRGGPRPGGGTPSCTG